MDQKFHFRRYRLSQYHPCLIAIVTEQKEENGKVLLSGFGLTHSVSAVISKPSRYVKIHNPNPNDDADCYLHIDPFKDKPEKLFTKPLSNWKLSEDDIAIVQDLIERKL